MVSPCLKLNKQPPRTYNIHIDLEQRILYRGYAAQDLCEYCKFEEVAYLILNRDLPNTLQLKKFEKEERNNRDLSKELYSAIKRMAKKSHPMDVARTAVSIMGLEDKETIDSS